MQIKYGQWLYNKFVVIIFYNINEEVMESRTIVTNYSKAQKNNAFQLPKINRTVLVHSESTLFDLNRYQWLAQDTDYSLLSQKQIEQEYRLLRKQLLAVNDTAARSIQMFKSQNLGKKKRNVSSDYHSEVMSQQIENNKSILGRLRQEFQRLQIRQKQLEINGKQSVEMMIEQIRDSIERVKQEIKQVSTKSREINNSFEKQSKIQEQIKRLEVEKQIVQRKRHKLEMKTLDVRQNNSKLAKQLNLVKEESQFAEQVIEEQLEAQKEKIEDSQMQRNHRHKKHQVQALTKNIQSIQTSKSLKYHGILKKIEEVANKFYRDDQQINLIEHSILITKKEICQLQQKLKYAKQSQKQQEKYVQILQQDNKNKFKDLKTQTQRQGSKIGRFNVHQKEKTDGFIGKLKGDKRQKSLKGRVLNISSNKNRTIEVTLQNREDKPKQIEIQTQQEPIKNNQKDEVTKLAQDMKKSTKKIQAESKALDAQTETPKFEYEKLKKWNEEASIDKLQVNKSSKKKIFNRILVDLNEVENQRSKAVKDNEKVQMSKQTHNNEIEQQFVFEQQIMND